MILHAFLISIGCFALLQFLIVPILKARLRASKGAAVVARAAVLATVGFLCTLALMSSVAMAAVMLCVAVFGGLPQSQLPALGGFIEAATEVLKVISTGWSVALCVTLVVILAIFAYRRGAATLRREMERVYRAEMERLRQDREAGRWEDLPPSAEMQAIAAHIARVVQLAESTVGNPAVTGHLREEQRRQLEQVRTQLENAWHQHDWRRRMNLDFDVAAFEAREGTVQKHRLARFFTSRGVLLGLKGGKRLVHTSLLALLFLSLVGVGADPAHEAAEGAVVRLRDLRLARTHEDAVRSYRAHLEQQGSDIDGTELDATDEALLVQIATQIEDSVLAGWTPSTAPEAARLLRSFRTRDAVLRSVEQRPTASGGRRALETMERAEGLGAVERATLERFSARLKQRGPQTPIGERALERLRAEVAPRPGVWQRVRQNYQARWHDLSRPVGIREASRTLVGEVFSHALAGVPPPEDVVGQLAGKIAKAGGTEAVKRYYDYVFMDAVESLTGTAETAPSPVRRAFTEAQYVRVKETVSEIPSDAILAEKLTPQPPAVAATVEPAADYARAKVHADRLQELHGRPTSSEGLTVASDAFATYEDYFPAQVGADTRSPRGVLLNSRAPAEYPTIRPTEGQAYMPPGPSGGGDAGRRPAGNRPSRTNLARTKPRTTSIPLVRSNVSAMRARSFVRLRGFARIGGVLIGRDPEATTEERPDIVGVSWRISDDSAEIVLRPRSGSPIVFGPFPAALVHDAMLYAADGRPTAVTMVTAPPLYDLRILLHPVLQDTRVGCQIIELDRFVDTYTSGLRGDTRRLDAHEFVDQAHDLYRFAHGIRLQVVAERLLPSVIRSANSATRGVLEALLKSAAIVEDVDVRANAATALLNLDRVLDPDRTPLVAKPEHYDQRLVTSIRASGHGARDLGSFQQRLTARLSGELAKDADWKNCLLPPPEYQIWSGVRELPYRLDSSLSDLDLHRHQGPRTWPFQFMLQVAFTSEPGFASASNATEEYFDQDPWEFPLLREYIATKVARNVARNDDDRAVLNEAAAFTILQRLFRNAYELRLGDDFPVEELATLAGDLARASRDEGVTTLRWNPKPGLLEATFARIALLLLSRAQERASAEPWLNTAIHDLQTMVGAAQDIGRVFVLPQSEWVRIFDVSAIYKQASEICPSEGDKSPACAIAELCEWIETGTEARALREALGLRRDEELIASGRGCEGP